MKAPTLMLAVAVGAFALLSVMQASAGPRRAIVAGNMGSIATNGQGVWLVLPAGASWASAANQLTSGNWDQLSGTGPCWFSPGQWGIQWLDRTGAMQVTVVAVS